MPGKEKMTAVEKQLGAAIDLLGEIGDQLRKIIEFKQKHPTGSGDELLRRQVGAYMLALQNLIEIDGSVRQAAEQVKQLCNEANLLLAKTSAIKKTAGIGMGIGGVSTTEEDEDDDGNK